MDNSMKALWATERWSNWVAFSAGLDWEFCHSERKATIAVLLDRTGKSTSPARSRDDRPGFTHALAHASGYLTETENIAALPASSSTSRFNLPAS
jgi:hypothetical protein